MGSQSASVRYGRAGAQWALFGAALGLSGVLLGEPVTAPEERELRLTVYRQGTALLADERSVSFPTDAYQLDWSGVAPALQRETVRFGAGKRALQGYRVRHRPVSMDALLQAYTGRMVGVEQDAGRGRPAQAEGILVSADPPLASVDGEVRAVEPDELTFPEGLPPHLGALPTLELDIGPVPEPGTATGSEAVVVSYLSDGFSWSADYVATLGSAGDQLDLVARATIVNRSGMDVTKAGAELIAGRVNMPRGEEPAGRGRIESAVARDGPSAAEPVGDLQRFALEAPVTIADGARYSRRLFVHSGIPVTRRYVLAADQRPKRDTGAGWRAAPLTLELEWTSDQGPLPAGAVRVYREDMAGAVTFVGGDRIADRPRGEPVRIAPGRPFDITARRRQTDFERLEPRIHAVAHTIEIRNGSSSAANVRIEEPMAGQWRITEANHSWERASAQLAVWRLTLGPGETRTLRYRARIDNG